MKSFISLPLTHLFNGSINLGVFPNFLKESSITPLFKSGNRKLAGNYRPITLAYIFAKVFEKCLKKRLISFFHTHEVIAKNQFGFIKGKSTINPLFEITKRISQALDQRKTIIGAFLDIRKAFDCVDVPILLRKLQLYGIREKS